MIHTEGLKIYGFGSFFRGAEIFNDIDFLIIHTSIDKTSCKVAIECKKLILKKIKKSHITMLSHQEEESLNFIKKSNALFLGIVETFNIETELDFLLNKRKYPRN